MSTYGNLAELVRHLTQLLLELHYGVAVELAGEVPTINPGAAIRTIAFEIPFVIERAETVKRKVKGQLTFGFHEDALAWSPIFTKTDFLMVDETKKLEFGKAPSGGGFMRFRMVNHKNIPVYGSSLEDVTMF